MADLLRDLSNRIHNGRLEGGSSRSQDLFNRAATESVDRTVALLRKVVAEPELPTAAAHGVPVYLFGNVLPDPDAFALFQSCGVHIAGDSVCTSTRAFSR